jgi:DNA-directed RNA polymerase specialized sigma subunit
MTNEEAAELWKIGNTKQKNHAFKTIMDINKGIRFLAWSKCFTRLRAKGVLAPTSHRDDYYSHLNMVMIRCLDLYNPKKGPFYPYLKLWIRNSQNTYLRKLELVDNHKESSLDVSGIGYKEDVINTVTKDSGEKKDSLRYHVYELFKDEDFKVRDVVFKKYGIEDGVFKTNQEVAKDLGVTASRVWQILDKAFKNAKIYRKQARSQGNVILKELDCTYDL